MEGREIVGFATAWTTLAPFPTDRCYPQAAAGLGTRRTTECGIVVFLGPRHPARTLVPQPL
ncbi:hypothetical protein [Streptomyces antibioticus]|uniref:hypothetical protein n=1 Tax=Streptomyces antibioticus TaxID=1890 RepID=UPI003F4CA262